MISITKMKSDSALTGTCSNKINLQLYKLIADLRDRPRQCKGVDNALKFWAWQRLVYNELADSAEDLIACPASQIMWSAYFWFLVKPTLSAGCRNRKCVSAWNLTVQCLQSRLELP